MKTLGEIETAVGSLSLSEQELLYSHLGKRLKTVAANQNVQLQALETLQASLGLNTDASAEWKARAVDSRR